MNNIKLSLLFTFIFLLPAAYANNSASCIAQLKKAFETEQNFVRNTISSGKGWHIVYDMTSEVLNESTSKYQVTTSSGEVIAATNYRYKKTNKAEVYINEHEVFSVSKNSNVVMRSRANPKDLKLADEIYTKSLQDTLFKLMEIKDCNSIRKDNKDLICYNLVAAQSQCPYSSAFVYVDPVNSRIYMLHIEMNPSYQKSIKQYTLRIIKENAVDIDSKRYDIASVFLNKNGKLKPPYDKYYLKDFTRIKDESVKSKSKLK